MMATRISRLSIKNFRSIQSAEFDVPELCALVGPNNAGKSNVLLALYRVLGSDWVVRADHFDDVADRYRKEANRDIEIEVSFAPPFKLPTFKGADPADIHRLSFKLTRYKVGAEKGEPRLAQECLDAGGKTVSVLKEAPKPGKSHQFGPLKSVPREVQAGIPLIYIRADRRLSDQLPSGRNSMLRRLLDDIDKDFHDPANTVDVPNPVDGSTATMPRRDRWGQLMRAAMKLLRTEEFLALEKDINQNALRQLGFNPDADDLALHFGPLPTIDFYRALDLQLTEAGLTVDATTLGHGFQNAVFLAILEAYEKRKKKGAIFLIEEPETSLHPQTQRALYKTLQSISAENQVIYATHSPHFVGIPEYQNVRLVRRGPTGTTVRPSTLKPSPETYERLRKEVDPERGELFFARKVLVVEGDTEKLALPEYARHLALELDRVGATIVEAGGKRNLLPLAELADSFGIPVGIVYDKDSGAFKDHREEEAELNAKLAAFDERASDRRSWQLDPDYEAALRTTLGESSYQEQCQKHPGVTKAVRARRIAEDGSNAIPPAFEEVLRWLADDSAQTPETEPALETA